MATRNTTGVERGRGREDGNRPRTHPIPAGRKPTKSHLTSSERNGGAL